MSANKLKMNSSKTEFIVFGSKFHIDNIGEVHINVGGARISPAPVVRNLGVMFDRELSMKDQVTNICRQSMASIRRIGKIRNVVDDDLCKTLINQLVTSRLDYCNSLLSGIPAVQLQRLQRIQNVAARIVTKAPFSEHTSPLLKSLHWLPIDRRVKFKVLMLTFNAMYFGPGYLNDVIVPYTPARYLRSQDENLLLVPRFRTNSYGGRAFSTIGPTLWNELPRSLRLPTSTISLRPFKHLKCINM